MEKIKLIREKNFANAEYTLFDFENETIAEVDFPTIDREKFRVYDMKKNGYPFKEYDKYDDAMVAAKKICEDYILSKIEYEPVKQYSVFVGGGEVNDELLSIDEAEALAEKYKKDRYDDVSILMYD